jgi:uncharacterized protein
MTKFRSLLPILVWVCAIATASADVPPQKAVLLRRMAEATEMFKTMDQMKGRMVQMLAEGNKLPPEIVNRFSEKWTSERMFNAFLPIYDRYYTSEDCEAIIAFYSTPVGKKLASSQAAMLAELGAAGRILGEKIVREVIEELEKEKQNSSP